MNITITDNSGQFIDALNRGNGPRALEKCGLKAEGYAKKLCPGTSRGRHSSHGNLRNSITHQVDTGELKCYVGTNSEYSVYVELGTGIYYPGGRDTPWVYKDAEGRWHTTRGNRAQPYIKPSVENYKEEYRQIIEDELRNG